VAVKDGKKKGGGTLRKPKPGGKYRTRGMTATKTSVIKQTK